LPSDKVLKRKQQIVEELTDKLKNAPSGVLVNYKGINVADDTALRKELREAGVEYFVVKNTYVRHLWSFRFVRQPRWINLTMKTVGGK